MQEDCAVCGTTVPFKVTTHVLVNPAGDEPVRDYYVCDGCYGAHLEGLFTATDEASEE